MKKIINYNAVNTTATTIRPIAGFENYYASNNGDIYHRVTINNKTVMRQLKRRAAHNGYEMYNLTDINGDRVSILGGRLVLMAFLPDVDFTCYEPDHLDGDKTNNNLSNLEWVTHSENCKRAKHTNQSGARKALYTIKTDDNGNHIVNEYYSRQQFATAYNISTATAHRLLNKHQVSKYIDVQTAFYKSDFDDLTDEIKDIIYDYEMINRLF